MTATLLSDTELERDRRLVEAHQAGDVSAFGQLYRLHHERLLRFCQRKTRDPHLAEEIAQEAFLKAYRALDGLNGGKRFYPWLTVIASRLAIDHHRRAGRVQPSAAIELGAVDDTHERMERQVDREQVLQALERVRLRHREVLRLRDYEDLSYDAIAQRLGTSPAVVQSLLHRARQALRREYLAVTEHAGLVPLLGPACAALRRLRARAGRAASWLPDPSALGAPLAAATLALGGALGAWTAPAPQGAASSGSAAAAVEPATGPAAARLVAQPAPAVGEPAGVPPSRQGRGPRAPAEVWVGPAGAAEARAHGEDMPARVDTGRAIVAADPETILEDTLHAAAGLVKGH